MKGFSGKGPLAPKPQRAGGKKRQDDHKGRPMKKAPRAADNDEGDSGAPAKRQQQNKKNKKTIAKMGREALKRKMNKVYEDEDDDEAGSDDDESNIYVSKGKGKLGPSLGGDFDDEEIEEDEAFNSDDETRYDVLDEILKRSKGPNKKAAKGGNKGKRGNEEEEEEEEEGFTSPDEDDEEVDISDLLPGVGKADDDDLMALGKKSRIMQELGDSEDEDSDDDEEEDSRADMMTNFIDELTASRKRKRAEQVTEPYKESEYNLAPKPDQAKLGLSDLLQSLGDNAAFSNAKKKLKVLTQSQPISVPLPKIIQDRVDRKVAYKQTKEEVTKWEPQIKENRSATHLSFPLGLPKNEYVSDPKVSLPTEPINDMEAEINKILVKSDLKQGVVDNNRELPMNEMTEEEIEDAKAEMKKLRSMMFFYEQKAKRLKKIKSKKYHKILKKEKLKKELSMAEIAMLDPERAKEMQNKMLLDRAAERMSLRHKTGGKWAKEMQKRHVVNDHIREATNERYRLSEQLRKKIQGEASDSEEEEDKALNSDLSDEELDGKFDETVAETEEGQEGATKGLMALKFMKAAEEKQKKQARELIERMRDQETEFDDLFEGKDGQKESDDEESEYDEEGVEKIKAEKPKKQSQEQTSSGRRAFGPASKTQPLDLDEPEAASVMKGRTLVDKVAISASHKTKVSGPVSVMGSQQKKGDALFDEQEFPEATESSTVLNSTKISFGNEKGTRKAEEGTDDDDSEEEEEEEDEDSEEEEDESEDEAKAPQTKKTARGGNALQVFDEEENPWLVAEEDVTLKVKSKKKAVKKEEVQASKMKVQARQTHQDKSEDPEVITTSTTALGVRVPEKKSGPKTAVGKSRKGEAVDQDDDFDASRSEFQIDDEAEVHSFAIQQRELIQRAFAEDDIMEEDFEAEKEALVDSETNKDQDVTLPGWGNWGGEGAKPSKKRIIIPAKPQDPRKDRHLKNVIINEKSMKTMAKFTVPDVPYGFRSKEHYERQTRTPVGKEWNTTKKSIELTKPKIATKAGTIIEPIKLQDRGN